VLVVCATNGATNLHPSFEAGCIIQLPIVAPATDVGVESFQHNGQRSLHAALAAIDAAREAGGRVLVCCQQGKDESVLVVLAYLRAKYGVSADSACV
jgi:protein-tyrosine phosphatase